MRILIATFFVPALAACASVGSMYTPHTLTGIYEHGWEVQSFRPCGSREKWWVGDAADLRPRAERAGFHPDGPLLVEVRATVSDRGRFGHMGAYSRQIGVQEVVRVEAASRGRC